MGGHTVEEGNQWVYHPKTGSKLIWLESLEWYLGKGWFMTPDDFPVEEGIEVVKPAPKKRGRKKKVT